MPLTKRQSEILTYLHAHIAEHGYAPSFEEIAEQFGFQSLATVHEHLTNLERKGYIRRSTTRAAPSRCCRRAAPPRPPRFPCSARWPPATRSSRSCTTKPSPCPTRCCPAAGPTTPSRCAGNSMIDEHILDGDFVVVHGRDSAPRTARWSSRSSTASEATVKKFYREPGGWIRLQPANATMSSDAVPGTRRADPGRRRRGHPEVLNCVNGEQ